MTGAALEAYRGTFTAFMNNGGSAEPAWLPALRRRGFDRFAALGFPTTRDEDWHYTSVAPIAETPFGVAPAAAGGITLDALSAHILDAAWNRLVFVNGRYTPALSSFAELPAEVDVATLAEALHENPAFVEANLATLASIEQNTFAALNTAFLTDGVVVRIPDECIVDTPLHVLWVSDASAQGAVTHPRLLVTAGRNSRAVIIETFAGLGTPSYFTNAVTEVRVGEGAHLDHHKVQRESPDAFHIGTLQAVQGRASVFRSFSFAGGARLSRTNIHTHMPEPGAEVRLNGLYLLDGHQHCDHQTFVHHAAEGCASRELYKGIIDDHGHGVFNGKVLVDPVAQKTDGKQTNHALLLSERAKVDTKPQLEIFADDVKCTHGATVGRLDENLLFYLKSRGIGRDTARALLMYAFAAEVLETIETPPLREALEALAFARYNQPAAAERE